MLRSCVSGGKGWIGDMRDHGRCGGKGRSVDGKRVRGAVAERPLGGTCVTVDALRVGVLS